MAMQLLFTSDFGLFSLLVIGFVIVMAAYLYNFARKNMDEDAKRGG